MRIEYMAPLRRAWNHAREMLFRPFNVGTWLVVGFSAWLANLMDGGGGGGGFPRPRPGMRWQMSDVAGPIRDAWSWITHHPHLAALIGGAAVVGITVALLLLWISSRAKFVFLDNVMNRRGHIAEPWRRFRSLANSLFLWRIGFFFISVALIAALAAVLLAAVGGLSGLGFATPRTAVLTAMGALFAVLLIVGTAYVALFVDSFVVPLMARYDLTATAAWAMLLPWAEARFGAFLLYGLFVLLWWVVVGLGVVAVGLATCCVGLLVVAMPYLGTVALLPVWVSYRTFSVEFLAQFDPALKAVTALQPESPAPGT